LLLDDQIRVFGPDSRRVLLTRTHLLAYVWGHLHAPREVAAAYQALLDDQRRILGPDHPDIRGTQLNLANWRRRAGDGSGDEVLQALAGFGLSMTDRDGDEEITKQTGLTEDNEETSP
jgi:hypothetical protein